jgi:hypothetical protein
MIGEVPRHLELDHAGQCVAGRERDLICAPLALTETSSYLPPSAAASASASSPKSNGNVRATWFANAGPAREGKTNKEVSMEMTVPMRTSIMR